MEFAMANVTIQRLCKSFGADLVLHDIDLDIASGEFVVFVGPSGCGKSTLLRLIAGLEEPSGGALMIDGVVVNDTPPAKREIAMVFQSYALYPHMSVSENMAFSLKLRKRPKAEIDAAVMAVAEMLDIVPLLPRLPRDLSGGQRQRVAIGRAIVRKPKVFLFDEPLSNLDADLRTRMRYELVSLRRKLGATMIYVTHDQVEAMTLADRIVVLSKGRVEQVGPPSELYERPVNLFVAGFLGSPKMNFIAGEIAAASAQGASVRIAGGSLVHAQVDASRAKPGDKVTLGVRPEDLGQCDSGGCVSATIEFVERLGGTSYAYLSGVGGADLLCMRYREGADAERGARVELQAPASSWHLFDAQGSAFARIS
jgi:multiple sugar transport system ATP-binding protein